MPDPRMDGALDHVLSLRLRLAHDAWVISFLELLVQEMLCTSEGGRDAVAREMLAVIREDDVS